MRNKICSIVKDLLPLYIENEVQDETKVFVENHLSECQDCKKEFEMLTTDFSEVKKVVDTTDDNRKFKGLVKSMVKKYILVPLAIILALVIVFLSVVVVNQRIGISYEDIESDFREFFLGEDEYTVISQTSEDEKIVALFYYNEELTKAGYLLYIQKDGMYFGYFRWLTDAVIYTKTYDYDYENKCYLTDLIYVNKLVVLNENETAYVISNQEKIVKISVDGEIIEVDSEKPFLQILPNNAEIVFYDINDNIVDLQIESYKSAIPDDSDLQQTTELLLTESLLVVDATEYFTIDSDVTMTGNQTIVVWHDFTTITGQLNITNCTDMTNYVVYLYDASNTSEPIAQQILDDSVSFTDLSTEKTYRIGIYNTEDFEINIRVSD